MKNARKSTIILVAAIVLIASAIGVLNNYRKKEARFGPYDRPLVGAPETANPLAGIAEDFSVGDSFSSHLPLVIIDTGGVRPPISTLLDLFEDIRYPIPGVEAVVNGSVSIINTGGVNRLTDAPETVVPVDIKRRGHSSMSYPKAQYLIKTVTESGQEFDTPILGMGADSEWVLNGAMVDKSLMRNYLSLCVASKFLPFTPDSVYCEVLYHENGQYYYEGVYLMIESIKQGPDRVDIPDSKDSGPFTSYIVRRDRYDSEANTLYTWATERGLTERYLTLRYPGRLSATEQNISFVTQDISQIEQVLYSDDFSVFSTYSRYIDVDSFVDYLIFNEFFGSYDAGLHSTYMYKPIGGKLSVGPVWDLDNATDNYQLEPLDVDVTAFQTKPWFDRLMSDANFLSKVEARYAELRRGPLSDETVTGLIDDIALHLGPAIDREWHRWNDSGAFSDSSTGYSFALQDYEDDYGDLMVRDTSEYRYEVYRLKTAIALHAHAIGPRLQTLQQSTDVRTGVSAYSWLILVAVLLVFALPSIYVSRK